MEFDKGLLEFNIKFMRINYKRLTYDKIHYINKNHSFL